MRCLRIGSWVCLLAGLGVLALGAYEIQLSDSEARMEVSSLNQSVLKQIASSRREGVPCSAGHGRRGHPFARLLVPVIGVKLPVVEGAGQPQLDTGAVGRIPGTGMPGTGNLALAAHVVSAGNPFLHLASLRPGDSVSVETFCGTYRYRVAWSSKVKESDTSVLGATRSPALTLITCWPATYYLTPWRTIVRAYEEAHS